MNRLRPIRSRAVAPTLSDDGLVLIQGELVEPARVQHAAARKFRSDGGSSRSVIARYAQNYPHPDRTTPTFAQFRVEARAMLRATHIAARAGAADKAKPRHAPPL